MPDITRLDKAVKWRKVTPQLYDPKNYAKEIAAYHKAVLDAFKELGPSVVAQFKTWAAKQTKKLAKADEDDIDLNDLADFTDQMSLDDLQAIVSDAGELGASVAGNTARIGIASFGLGNNSDIVNQADRRAATWATNRAAELVGMRYDDNGDLVPSANAAMQIDSTTRDMIRQSVADGLENGDTLDEITNDIGASYAFSSERAALIASTEVASAHSQGQLAAGKEAAANGVAVKKYWIVDDDPCDVCLDNEDDGEIDLDDDFSSGDDAPLAHPDCFCALGMVAGDEVNEE